MAASALVGVGVVFGLLVFTNPAPATMGVGMTAFVWQRTRRVGSTLRVILLIGIPMLMVCAPWIVRNARVLHVAALRPNFGVEMHVGNNDISTGRSLPIQHHPSCDAYELGLYRRLGEAAYSTHCMQRAGSWIRHHPGRFAGLMLRRIQFFWLGDPPISLDRRLIHHDWRSVLRFARDWIDWLAFGLVGVTSLVALSRMERGSPESLLLRVPIGLFGLPYFVTHVSERYRLPIDPLMVLCAAYLLTRFLDERAEEDEIETVRREAVAVILERGEEVRGRHDPDDVSRSEGDQGALGPGQIRQSPSPPEQENRPDKQ
jgi:hypothetical protein